MKTFKEIMDHLFNQSNKHKERDALGLLNLSYEQKEEDARQSVAELKRLADMHADQPKIVSAYAYGLGNLSDKQKEEE